MVNQSFFSAPVFEGDEEKTRTASLLHTSLMTFIGAVAITVLIQLTIYGLPDDLGDAFTLLSGTAIGVLSLWLLYLNRRGRTRLAGALLSAVFWIVMTIWILFFSGLRGDNSVIAYPLIIVLAGLLTGISGAVAFTLLSAVVVVMTYFIERAGLISYPQPTTSFFQVVIIVAVLILTTLLLRHSVRSTAQGFALARQRAQKLEESNRELEAARLALEQRSADLQASVQKYVNYMTEVAMGNLTTRLAVPEEESQDPLIILGQKLNQTIGGLQKLILRIRETASNLASASAEILAAVSQQATGISEQSAAISQASSTIDEVRAIAEETTQRAQSVADVAQRTATVSATGQQAVSDTITGVEQVKSRVESIAATILALSEQTQAIGQIIATVDKIAYQSDMLALNAAVEAARAGEAGRGFAVVASEVRRLAEQSQEATDQVREILSEIQKVVNTAVMTTEEGMKKADAGARLAGEAGQAIRRLAGDITTSAQAAVQIAAAAGQQRTGMEQIAQAMEHIHQVSVQNLSGVQQVEKAAAELNEMASLLREMVEKYQL